MVVQFQIRRDTATDWTADNPVLPDGQLGYEKDTKKLKIGDGSTAWNSLEYFTGAGADEVALLVENNLAELSGTAATARANLGLGSAATHASTDFDAAGAAATAQATAESFATTAAGTAESNAETYAAAQAAAAQTAAEAASDPAGSATTAQTNAETYAAAQATAAEAAAKAASVALTEVGAASGVAALTSHSVVPGAQKNNPVVVTGPVTYTARDGDFMVISAAAGNVTIDLPAHSAGAQFSWVRTDGSVNTITVTPPSGTISGAASSTPVTQWLAESIVDDGTNYEKSSNNVPGAIKWRGAWAANTYYAANDVYTENGGVYIVTSSYVSGSTFGSTDTSHTTNLVPQSGTYAPIASPTFTGITTAPEFSASGLTGAAAASRYVGATTSGAPVSGTFAVGDFVIDQTGAIWICVTAGTPGIWAVGGSGVELAEAELSSDSATFTTTTSAISGLSITFTAPARPFVLELTIPELVFSASGINASLFITDGSGTTVAAGYAPISTALLISSPAMLRARLPRTGGANAYAITPGNSYTFEAQGLTTSGTAYCYTNSGKFRPILRAVTC